MSSQIGGSAQKQSAQDLAGRQGFGLLGDGVGEWAYSRMLALRSNGFEVLVDQARGKAGALGPEAHAYRVPVDWIVCVPGRRGRRSV